MNKKDKQIETKTKAKPNQSESNQMENRLKFKPNQKEN